MSSSSVSSIVCHNLMIGIVATSVMIVCFFYICYLFRRVFYYFRAREEGWRGSWRKRLCVFFAESVSDQMSIWHSRHKGVISWRKGEGGSGSRGVCAAIRNRIPGGGRIRTILFFIYLFILLGVWISQDESNSILAGIFGNKSLSNTNMCS